MNQQEFNDIFNTNNKNLPPKISDDSNSSEEEIKDIEKSQIPIIQPTINKEKEKNVVQENTPKIKKQVLQKKPETEGFYKIKK